MQEVSTSNARQAALALHALSGVDQQWLLDELGTQQQALLQPLLQELRDIGMPTDLGRVKDLCSQPSVRATGEAAKPPAIEARQLAGLNAVLDREPPRLLAALAAGSSREWRERAFAGFPSALRDEVEVELASRRCAPALQAAVATAVRRTLAQQSRDDLDQGAGIWARVKASVATRRRVR